MPKTRVYSCCLTLAVIAVFALTPQTAEAQCGGSCVQCPVGLKYTHASGSVKEITCEDNSTCKPCSFVTTAAPSNELFAVLDESSATFRTMRVSPTEVLAFAGLLPSSDVVLGLTVDRLYALKLEMCEAARTSLAASSDN